MPQHDPKIKEQLDAYIDMKTGGGKPIDKPKDGKEDPKDKPKDKPKPPVKPVPTDRIPLPDYKDPASREKYANEFHKKYGELTAGLGDTPLRINEKAFWASDTGKNMSVKTASQLKLDPALLYSSAMVEGMSGLYPDKDNRAKSTGDKDYPVSGLWSFGLDSFDKGKADELIKKGYLPADFANQFKMFEGEGGPSGKDYKNENAMFKTTDAGLQAKAAMLKASYDDIEAYAKKKGIPLSDKAKDFFALANFNGGEGVGHEMLTDYNNNGLLKDDAYLKKRPTSGKGLKDTSYKKVYDNVKKRIVMADALKKEGYFDEDNATNQ